MTFTEAVLAFIEERGMICLRLQKADALFGANSLVLPGGKLHPGETKEAAIIREVKEEIALLLTAFSYAGLLETYINRAPWWRVHLFRTASFTRLKGAPETTVEWYAKQALPFESMRATDALWMPRIISGENIHIELNYAVDKNTLIDSAITAIN